MLTLRLVCVGRMKAGAERELCTRYLDRAGQMGRPVGLHCLLHELAESRARRPADRKTEEAAAIRAIVADSLFIAFDETGGSIDSPAFADIFRKAAESGGEALAMVIGGPDGLDPAIRASAHHVIALGAMTWPHRLVRIMVAEQVYRATTILAGHPYHRD